MLGLLSAPTAPAQIVLDGKFGSGSLSGPNFTITEAMGSTRGNNLFHSFSQFNVAAGETATFTGSANIQNILARVTGGTSSTIDGTLRSGIAGANLFLINPNGIIFGPNAVIDVTGSFAASSANYLKLADGARFVASLDADDSALSTAPVSAFGFLNGNAGSISVEQSTLQVPTGNSITLVGGDISFNGGSLKSSGGQINVASVRSAGEIPADLGTLSSADFRSTFPQAGQIEMLNGAQLDASGDGGGRIVIRSGTLTVDNSKIAANTTGASDGQGIDVVVNGDLKLLNGGQITSVSTMGLGAGGNININAGSILLDGGGAIDDTGYPSTQISTATGDSFEGGGPGKGGDITIETGHLEIDNSAQISAASFGAGDAGSIDITASSIRMDALQTTVAQLSANTQLNDGGGKAGDIIIHTDTLEMLNASGMWATSYGSGQAGRVDITAHTVNINSSSVITAGTFGSGIGGDVRVTTDVLRIDGRDTLFGGPDLLSGIQAVTTDFMSPAPGGNIQIIADSIEISHGGSIFTTSYGAGPGGNIQVNAGNLKLGSGSTITAQGYDVGAAGQISVNVENNLSLSGSSAISTAALSSSGGNIDVTAGSEIRLVDSQIAANAGLDGGNITISAPSLIYLQNSSLNAQADTTGSGFGNGGNLTIDPSFLVLNNSSLISKSSFGNGGSISIFTDFFFQSASIIDASAPFGLPGTVSVTAPKVDLSGSLVSLPGNLLDAASQLRPDCGVRQTEDVSSFVVLGSGGLPLQPGGFVPSSVTPPHAETP